MAGVKICDATVRCMGRSVTGDPLRAIRYVGLPYVTQAMAGMKMAGRPLGIEFDYNVFINRQPIDSQRMLLYAARHGKQEAYVSALSRRHFTQGSSGESASKKPTVLAAAVEAQVAVAVKEAAVARKALPRQACVPRRPFQTACTSGVSAGAAAGGCKGGRRRGGGAARLAAAAAEVRHFRDTSETLPRHFRLTGRDALCLVRPTE